MSENDITRFNGNEVIVERAVRTDDPTATDDASHGFRNGGEWINTVSKEKFVLVDDAPGAAVWHGGGAGVISTAALNLATVPTAADTVVIGADTYEWQAAAADLADDANIAVLIGGDAGISRDNLIAAINAVDADNKHPTIFQTDSVTPALANGTEQVLADEVGTQVRVKSALSAGGAVAATNPSIVLGETLTAGADLWDVGDVNMNTLGAAESLTVSRSRIELTVSAAMITDGDHAIDFPHTVRGFQVQIRTAADKIKAAQDDTFVAAGSVLTITFPGLAGDVAATDILSIYAWS